MNSKVPPASRGDIAVSPEAWWTMEKHLYLSSGRQVFGRHPDASESVFSSKKCMLLVTGGAFIRVLKSRDVFPGPLDSGKHTELQIEPCHMSDR